MKIRKARRAQINRAFKELKGSKETDMDYTCIFVNRSKAPYHVHERGQTLFDVPPESESQLDMFKPSVSWARWSKVVIGKDGEIETLVENTHWAAPWRKDDDWRLIEVFNEDGSSGGENIRLAEPNKALRHASSYVLVPKGIPTILPIRLDDPLVKYSKLHWKRVVKRIPVGTTGYVKKSFEVIVERTPRPQAELLEVFNRLAAINAARFEKEQRERLGKQLGLPEEALDGK